MTYLRHGAAALVLFSLGTVVGEELTSLRDLPAGPTRIVEDRQGRIYVAVFGKEGKLARSVGAAVGSGRKSSLRWEVLAEGDLGGLQMAPNGDVWVVQGDKVWRYPHQTEATKQRIDRTASFRPDASLGPLFASRWGDVWCAGCRARRTGQALYVPVPLAAGNWSVKPVADDPFGNTWALTSRAKKQGLAVLSRKRPHRWESIPLAGELQRQTCRGATTDDAGFIWLAFSNTLLQVDPRSPAVAWRTIKNPASTAVTAIARLANRQILVASAAGAIRELDLPAGKPPQWKVVVSATGSAVQAMLHDRRGELWFVRGGQLCRQSKLVEHWQAHWDEQPRMPAGNHDHIFARIGNRLYTAGGKTYFGWPASKWVNLDHIWSYDIRQGTWRVEPPMLEPGKSYSGIAALDGELWLMGGYFRVDDRIVATRTVEIFDPRTRRSRLGPALHQPLGQVVALTANNRIFAIGGGNREGNSNAMFSIAAGETKWKQEPPAPGPVVQASGCVLHGKLYVAAGPATKCPGLFVYDPVARHWSTVKRDTPPPSAPLCAAFQGEVWIMGGRGPQGAQASTEVFSPQSGKWRKGPDLPLPVSWAAAAEVRGRLLIAGGAYEESHVGNFFNSDRVFFLRQ